MASPSDQSATRRLLARSPRLYAVARSVRRRLAGAPARPPGGLVPLRPLRPPTVDEENHPEALALQPYCVGRGIDVGCGHRKVAPHCIGVDLLGPGEVGEHGVVHGQRSVADIQASGDDLHMFADGELDYVVSRHNLEHYVDVVKTLQEWARVTRAGGTVAMVVPDERAGDTIFLDPTHKHVFTPESLERLIGVIDGLRFVQAEVVTPNWSFMAVTRREGPDGEARS
jgi:SAM-dependent methyltransferase